MMAAVNNRRLMLLLAMVWCSLGAAAQQYRLRASIGAIPEAGFYALNITPALSAQVQANMCDLRIKDSASAFFTPYIIRKGPVARTGRRFKEFAITASHADSTHTIVELENSQAQGITGITLLIGNTAVERYTSLSGSNDGRQWYIIDDKILFHRSYDNEAGAYAQTISFPLSKYRYFRLRIDNAHTDPLHIIKAGRMLDADTAIPPSYMENPRPSISQADSGGVSYVWLRNAAPYITGRMQIEVGGQKFYKREAVACIRTSAADTDESWCPIVGFQLTSGVPAVINIPPVKAYSILIKIYNGDNPPLKVTAAATYLETQQLVVWLEPGHTYYLLAGNERATMPDYDLSHFRDSIPARLPVLAHGPLQPLGAAQVAATPAKENSWLWPAIVAAVMVLGLLTYRLLGDLKQKEGGGG